MSSYKPPFARMNSIHAAIQGRAVPGAEEAPVATPAPAANVTEALQNIQAVVVEEVHAEAPPEVVAKVTPEPTEAVLEELPPEHVEAPEVKAPEVKAEVVVEAPAVPKVDESTASKDSDKKPAKASKP